MDDLRIHTHIHSRYQVFDASGQLPFSIVFGFCRRSPHDTDPRPLSLAIAGSALDVPYALARGLLTLHRQDRADSTQWLEVDLSRLKKVAAKEAGYLALPSPVNRTEHWREAFMVYHCHIDAKGELASMLEPETKYRIRLASEDLGVKEWAYEARKLVVEDNERPGNCSKGIRLVNSKPTAGNATFRVVDRLPWPPRIETRFHLCTSSLHSGSALVDAGLNSRTVLEVSVVNTGSDSVTVQTRGHQRFLSPWGPFQPEPDSCDNRMRIIDATPHKPPSSSLLVVDSVTNEVVRESRRPRSAPLTDSNADKRPKAEDVVILKPGSPILRKIDIQGLLDGLEDGNYKIRMLAKGCRWWQREVGEAQCEDGRVPERLGGPTAPPLMLESHDEIELSIRHGKANWST